MKSYLIFIENGEIKEYYTSRKTFTIEDYSEYKNYKIYNNYVVMYNTDGSPNPTKFEFTSDKFNSKIALIKIGKDLTIKNITLKEYANNIFKTVVCKEPIDYSSCEEIDDKEPFEF